MSMMQAGCCCGACSCPDYPESFTASVTFSGYLNGEAVSASGSVTITAAQTCSTFSYGTCPWDNKLNGTFPVYNPDCSTIDYYTNVGTIIWTGAVTTTAPGETSQQFLKLFGAVLFMDGGVFRVAIYWGIDVIDTYVSPSIFPGMRVFKSSLDVCGYGSSTCSSVSLSCAESSFGSILETRAGTCANYTSSGFSATVTVYICDNGVPANACDDPSGTYTLDNGGGLSISVDIS